MSDAKVPEEEHLNFKAPLNFSTNCLQCVNNDLRIY